MVLKLHVLLCVTQGKTVKGRVLVIADGATSKLAMQMGYCTEPPKGVCSRAFIEGGTHNVDFDGLRRQILFLICKQCIAASVTLRKSRVSRVGSVT